MAVQVSGAGYERDGYKESMTKFRQAHINNTNALINIAAGRDPEEELPPYDPDHPDNKWPKMIFHPSKGELTIGKSLVGLTGTRRRETEKENQDTLEAALNVGYRTTPYVKPQIAVLDPAVEKAALMKRNQELEGMITQQADALSQLKAAVEKLQQQGGKK
jgi:hypothetical protein